MATENQDTEFIEFEDLTKKMKHVNHWEAMIDGVHAINGTADELWERAIKYFKWCQDHPIPKPEVLRSGIYAGKRIYVPIERPYTISGLCLQLGITQQYLYDVINSSEQNEFSFVAQRIIAVSYTHLTLPTSD